MNVGNLVKRLIEIGDAALASEAKFHSAIEKSHPRHRASARNLVHYLALRRFDLRPIQEELADRGLSSLGRAEGCVLFSLRAVLQAIGEKVPTQLNRISPPPLTRLQSIQLLQTHTAALLGPKPADRSSAIMVTMPTEAAHDPALTRRLLEAGMDIARINCTHDSEAVWLRMVENLRRGAEDANRAIRVVMDLAGPKLRTGGIRHGPRFCRWRPGSDPYGQRIEPARIWLTTEQSSTPHEGASATLVFPEEWLDGAAPGNEVLFFDIRGRPRSLRIVERFQDGVLAESRQGATVSEETAFLLFDPTSRPESRLQRTGFARALGDASSFLLLRRGSRFRLVPAGSQAPAERGTMPLPAIEMEPAEALRFLREGQTIWFDDGRIGGVICSASTTEAIVEVTRAHPEGEKLEPNRGINLPETDLGLPPLSDKDRSLLPWILEHADGIGLSFVRSPSDVTTLQEALRRVGGEDLPIIVKIETQKAFESLPAILLTAMQSPSVGVMIARGDLAVECGYERLAEVQEEILWVAEAAHLPVIWATQVLETLAATGLPSRAEVTDAAMAERSECVMLNKGPYIEEALRFLHGVLQRMEAHQRKKRSMLRHLRLADLFEEGGKDPAA